MKKIILSVAIVATMLTQAMAIERPSILLKGGIKGSLLVPSKVANKADASFNAAYVKKGLRLGVGADFNLYEYNKFGLSVIPSLEYAVKGVNKQGSEATFHNIELPVLLNLRYGDLNGLSFFANAGMYISYSVSGTHKGISNVKITGVKTGADGKPILKDNKPEFIKEFEYSTFNPFKKNAYVVDGKPKLNEQGQPIVGENKLPILDPVTKEYQFAKRFDYGLQCGLGVEYKKVQIGVSAQYGLRKIIDIPIDNINNEFKTIAAFITLGYRF